MEHASPLDIIAAPVRKGGIIGLACGPADTFAGPVLYTPHADALALLKAGSLILGPEGAAKFRVLNHCLTPHHSFTHARRVLFLEALADEPGNRTLSCTVQRNGIALAWLTLSDKGFAGLRNDLSGPLIEDMVRARLPLCCAQGFILPDEERQIRALLIDLACTQGYELILTTGGTGVSPRDATPQATLAVIEQRLPGIEQAMLAASLAKTPHAAISRAVAGTLGTSLIVNLPGSRKAVAENLESILPALPHLLEKLSGSPVDCGGPPG
jgi:molybdenum cofactor synthesis domain-containing protein